MKKNGFTLIEIIISIGVILILGVASFFGVRFVTNNIRINKLSQITDKALVAAQVYLESNEEAKNQLYNQKNGVVLPLKLLVNEGLLSLENTDLDNDDIKNEYVMTALSSGAKNGDCTEINEVTSWDSSAPIYLCINQSGGSTSANFQTVGASANNISRVTRETYYFKSLEENIVRYKYNNVDYDFYIHSVEKDDSLILMSKDSFGNIFSGVTDPISYYERASISILGYGKNLAFGHTTSPAEKKVKDTEVLVTIYDLMKMNLLHITYAPVDEVFLNDNAIVSTIFLLKARSGYSSTYCSNSQLGKLTSSSYFNQYCDLEYVDNAWYKIHLSPCMKIVGGTGKIESPYKLLNQC